LIHSLTLDHQVLPSRIREVELDSDEVAKEDELGREGGGFIEAGFPWGLTLSTRIGKNHPEF